MVDNKWIINNDNIEISEPILKVMHRYLIKYGFILRYPKQKENITQITYEPWHIRYVGTELANYLNQNNLVLDEYVVGYGLDYAQKYRNLPYIGVAEEE